MGRGPDWLPGEREEEEFGSRTKPVSIVEALWRVIRLQSKIVAVLGEGQEEDREKIMPWTRTSTEISALQMKN